MLNKYNLQIAALCSREASRFTLNKILVTPDFTAETDGHQLIRVTTPKQFDPETFPEVPGCGKAAKDFKPFLIPSSDALDLIKAIPKKQPIPILDNVAVTLPADPEGDPILVITDLQQNKTYRAAQEKDPKRKETFPDFNRVMPKVEKAVFEVHFDCALLGRVMRQIENFNRSGSTGMAPARIRFYDPEVHDGHYSDSAIRIDAVNDETGQELTAVVMPMRLDDLPVSNMTQRRRVKADQMLTDFTNAWTAMNKQKVADDDPARMQLASELFVASVVLLDREKPMAEKEALRIKSAAVVDNGRDRCPLCTMVGHKQENCAMKILPKAGVTIEQVAQAARAVAAAVAATPKDKRDARIREIKSQLGPLGTELGNARQRCPASWKGKADRKNPSFKAYDDARSAVLKLETQIRELNQELEWLQREADDERVAGSQAAGGVLQGNSLTAPLVEPVVPKRNGFPVDPERLRCGKGDICCSYSADILSVKKIRKPFEYDGKLWVSTVAGVTKGDFYEYVQAQQVVLKSQYKGKTHGDRTRYDGLLVKQGRNEYVLTGPSITLIPQSMEVAVEVKIDAPMGIDYLARIKNAREVDEGQRIIEEIETNLNALERAVGLDPTVGEHGSGFAYRGLATLRPTERAVMARKTYALDPKIGDEVQRLLEQYVEAYGFWEQMYRKRHEGKGVPAPAAQKANAPAAATHMKPHKTHQVARMVNTDGLPDEYRRYWKRGETILAKLEYCDECYGKGRGCELCLGTGFQVNVKGGPDGADEVVVFTNNVQF
jgi:hypothetical protein